MKKRSKKPKVSRIIVYADTNDNGRLEKQGDGWLIERNGYFHAAVKMASFDADGIYCESRET